MIRQRVRLRFRKEGDLRFISHRDLVRTFERLFRRAGLELGMSEGFHPKPRMTFPSALGLGIAATDEVMEFELANRPDADDLRERIEQQCPAGLSIKELQLLDEGQKKARIECVGYSIPVPEHRRPEIAEAIDRLKQQETCVIQREGRSGPVDVLAYLDAIELDAGVLRFRLRVGGQSGVRPREMLDVLGLEELESEGLFLTRESVGLAVANQQSPTLAAANATTSQQHRQADNQPHEKE